METYWPCLPGEIKQLMQLHSVSSLTFYCWPGSSPPKPTKWHHANKAQRCQILVSQMHICTSQDDEAELVKEGKGGKKLKKGDQLPVVTWSFPSAAQIQITHRASQSVTESLGNTHCEPSSEITGSMQRNARAVDRGPAELNQLQQTTANRRRQELITNWSIFFYFLQLSTSCWFYHLNDSG